MNSMNNKTLGSLRNCERVVVVNFCDEFKCHKLIDMGVLPGVVISFLGVSPLGGTVEICLRGHCLSIRKSVAEQIFVESADSVSNSDLNEKVS